MDYQTLANECHEKGGQDPLLTEKLVHTHYSLEGEVFRLNNNTITEMENGEGYILTLTTHFKTSKGYMEHANEVLKDFNFAAQSNIATLDIFRKQIALTPQKGSALDTLCKEKATIENNLNLNKLTPGNESHRKSENLNLCNALIKETLKTNTVIKVENGEGYIVRLDRRKDIEETIQQHTQRARETALAFNFAANSDIAKAQIFNNYLIITPKEGSELHMLCAAEQLPPCSSPNEEELADYTITQKINGCGYNLTVTGLSGKTNEDLAKRTEKLAGELNKMTGEQVVDQKTFKNKGRLVVNTTKGSPIDKLFTKAILNQEIMAAKKSTPIPDNISYLPTADI